jgi:CPA2 family monovalent cation:H+ antiporter-2
MRAGVALSQAGEFSVLLLAAASQPSAALISQDDVGVCVAVVVISLIATPGLVQASAWFNGRLPRLPAPRWAKHITGTARAKPQAEANAHGAAAVDGQTTMRAIIAGYGLVGRAVAEELKSMNVASTIIELNPATFRKQLEMGRRIVFGDASNPDVLETAGIHQADILVLTIPDGETVLRACKLAKQMRPGIIVVVRSNFVGHGVIAAGLGADGVVVEEMATAREMERAVKILVGQRREDERERQTQGSVPSL